MDMFRDVNGAYIVRSFFSDSEAQRREIALSVMFVTSYVITRDIVITIIYGQKLILSSFGRPCSRVRYNFCTFVNFILGFARWHYALLSRKLLHNWHYFKLRLHTTVTQQHRNNCFISGHLNSALALCSIFFVKVIWRYACLISGRHNK